MAKELLWTAERLEQYIKECVKSGASLSSAQAPSAARRKAIDYFGSWKGLLKHCGVKRKPSRTAKNNHYVKTPAEIKSINTAQGLEVRAPDGSYFNSICWECFRPISPKENYCPWHDHFEVPENAIFFKTLKTSTNPPSQIVTIVNCPLFIEETKELRKKKHEADIRQASYMRAQLMAAAYDK